MKKVNYIMVLVWLSVFIFFVLSCEAKKTSVKVFPINETKQDSLERLVEMVEPSVIYYWENTEKDYTKSLVREDWYDELIQKTETK